MQALYEEYEDLGFIIFTLLAETYDEQVPQEADLMEWADLFGITHPVLADADFGITFSFITTGSVGMPSMHIVRDGGIVTKIDIHGVSDGDITSNLP